MHRECERARQWASMDVDRELSAFEGVLLNAHLNKCADCRAFRSTVGGFTTALRLAPPEPFTAAPPHGVGRRVRRPLTSAAAAAAFLAVGLGSIVASSHLGSGLERSAATPPPASAILGSTHDAVNQRTLSALQRLATADSIGRLVRSGGGPFVQSR